MGDFFVAQVRIMGVTRQISIPKDFADTHGIEKGDFVKATVVKVSIPTDITEKDIPLQVEPKRRKK